MSDGPSVAARVPLATYRWQFNRGFTFRDASRLASYLRDLGISDVYASPYLKASAESTHGYDVVDHAELNPALGEAADYDAFCAALREHGLGQLLDIVPNHMGIAEAGNRWWMDILENGPGSPYAAYFDITWDLLKPELANKVLLPILGDQYGSVLERGELVLSVRDGAFFLGYYKAVLPIAPDTYGHLLQPCLGALAAQLEPADPRLLELQSVISAVTHLPRREDTAPERVAERQRETLSIKHRLATLIGGSSEFLEAVEATLRILNGVPGEATSFDLLDGLLDEQAYRLAYWRVASEEINYRRFFDVNQLAAVRVEVPEVFQATHQLILRLLTEGRVTGLRIDHPDGLWDPGGYLHQLQTSYRELCVAAGAAGENGASAGAGRAAELAGRLERRLPLDAESRAELPLYVVVEKILARGESLRPDWPVQGTTGYDFATLVGGLQVDRANRRAFDDLYARFIGRRIDYRELVNSTKKLIMLVSLASEVYALAHRLNLISEQHRRLRDFTLNNLTFAIREIIAALSVYRTYSICEAAPSKTDQDAIEAAVAEALRLNPRTDPSIFTFIRDLLLLQFPAGADLLDRARQCDFVMKFQQTTGPVMAKGVEDTAFYIYNRLVSLNEVGGEPDQFGVSVEEFHAANAARARDWPNSLLATTTHDTKRSEDVRARISVLSEIPREFSGALGRWSRLNARHRRRIDGRQAPDRNDEYLIYQSLLGAWPFEPLEGPVREAFVARLQAYLEKATHEAKVHTSWINPNEDYDLAVREFIGAILDPRRGARFIESFAPLQHKVAYYGAFNSLSQTLLKLTAPGVPDIYQGNELWDLSLVDPDNRRPVDYGLRTRLLRELQGAIAQQPERLADLLAELLESYEDGRIKLYVTERTLALRQRLPDLFRTGGYEPLVAQGARAAHVCAFARGLADWRVVIVTPRLMSRLAPGQQLGPPLGGSVWHDDWLDLGDEPPGRHYQDSFTGQTLTATERDGRRSLRLADLFSSFPVALLELMHD